MPHPASLPSIELLVVNSGLYLTSRPQTTWDLENETLTEIIKNETESMKKVSKVKLNLGELIAFSMERFSNAIQVLKIYIPVITTCDKQLDAATADQDRDSFNEYINKLEEFVGNTFKNVQSDFSKSVSRLSFQYKNLSLILTSIKETLQNYLDETGYRQLRDYLRKIDSFIEHIAGQVPSPPHQPDSSQSFVFVY